jgi:quercetin dioxygenase-like cupin family protein
LIAIGPARIATITPFTECPTPCSLRAMNTVEKAMRTFNLQTEKQFDPKKHIENILGKFGEGDVSVACWEPGQISPHHSHPNATEIYFCFEGGGKMRVPNLTVDVVPGSFVVHPAGELHEFENGPQRTLLFRVRYGQDMSWRTKEWRGNPNWKATDADIAYFREHPAGQVAT